MQEIKSEIFRKNGGRGCHGQTIGSMIRLELRVRLLSGGMAGTGIYGKTWRGVHGCAGINHGYYPHFFWNGYAAYGTKSNEWYTGHVLTYYQRWTKQQSHLLQSYPYAVFSIHFIS